MKSNFFNKKFPTTLGILFLIIVIGVSAFFLNKEKLPSFKKESEVKAVPLKIHISNVSNDQFVISWLTTESASGFIRYGTTADLENILADDRDQNSGETGQYKTHLVSVKDLEQGRTYYFKIGVGEATSENKNLYDNNGQSYTVITGPVLGQSTEDKILTGTIYKEDRKPADNTIVYLTASNIAPLSVLTDTQGRWSIFLNKARAKDLKEYAAFDVEATILKIVCQDGEQETSAVILTKDILPAVPDLVLGHEPYDFREGTGQTPEIFVAVPEVVTIDNPAEEGEKINTAKPEFQGKGPVDMVLTIKVESSQVYTTTVTVAEDGAWRLVPPFALTEGEHKISVSYTTKDGKTEMVSKGFYVLAAGDSQLPALTATPSGKPVASTSPSPISTPSASPSASPSEPPRVSIPSTDQQMPATGEGLPTLILLIAGVLLILGGLVLPI